MLKIENLHVSVGDKPILKGINLQVHKDVLNKVKRIVRVNR